MELIAHRFASGIEKEETISLTLKQAVDANIGDLLNCQPITIRTPEYFCTLPSVIKDSLSGTFEDVSN
jgi:hypothetical protein